MANPAAVPTSAVGESLGAGGRDVWQFSSDFADIQRTRVERLIAWRSYGEIVDAVVSTSVVVPGSVIWKQRDKAPTEAHRIECKADADRDAVDALFNSAQDYCGRSASTGIASTNYFDRKAVALIEVKDLSFRFGTSNHANPILVLRARPARGCSARVS